MNAAPRPVVVRRPDDSLARPILVEIPHAGVGVPSIEEADLLVDEDDRRRDADLHVDALYQDATRLGATLLYTEISRFVVDLNRDENDVDARAVAEHPAPRADAPRGLLWRVTTDGKPAQRMPLPLATWQRRVALYHRPYHAAIDVEVARLRARFGQVVILSGHSMPSVGKATHADPGRRRADVVPGDLEGHACAPAVRDAAVRHFAAAGLSVAPNDPYKGGNTTRRLGRPDEGLHALQIELNRDLYQDERSCVIKPEAFARLRGLCHELVGLLGTALPR